MQKEFIDIVDMMDELCFLLENTDVVMNDFYSENYPDFKDIVGTYEMMECRFNESRIKARMLGDMIRETIKNAKKLKSRIYHYHSNM